MRKATICIAILLFIGAGAALAQESEYLFSVPVSEDLTEPYSIGIHSGARDVAGPYDLDGDGQMEVLVADYTGGGRAHVIENRGPNLWEWEYSTPWLDSTATTGNARTIAGADLDNDGNSEILFFAGRGYSDTNPNIDALPPGLYAFEYNGTDFGDLPAAIYQFGDDLPDRWVIERLEVEDIDGDGIEEVMFGNNGSSNRYDNWYILSVSGDIGSGFEVWVEEARVSSRASEDFDPVDRGGGSPSYIASGDFDGDGAQDLTLHSWNSFNQTTGRVLGPDQYEFPGDGAANSFIHATSADYVALFGGTVIDIDQDGNDEAFFPVYSSGSSVLLNYDPGENTLEITEDNIVVDIFGGTFSSLGIGSGDLDGDGSMEVFGSGPSFTGESFGNGNTPAFFRIAEYQGGDVEDPASYVLTDVDYFEALDTTEAFDTVHRDSAGVETTYYENGVQGPEFVSKFAYLGDPDNDGVNELAIAFQGVDDSTYVIEETFNPATNLYERTTVSATARENRVFMRVLSGAGLSVKIVDERVIMPQDYKLSDNYPNPFNPSTSFSYTLPLDNTVSVKIYDVTGRLVKSLLNDQFTSAGTHEVTWDGTNDAGHSVASGTYIYTLEWGQFVQSKKMVLVK